MIKDRTGNEHERKNLYVSELAQLITSNAPKEKIASFKQKKKTHPYVIKLKNYLKQEKVFKRELKNKLKSEKKIYDGRSRIYKKLKTELLKVQKELEFYQNFQDISYDALFACKCAAIKIKEIPVTIDSLEKIESDIQKNISERKNLRSEDIQQAKEKFIIYKKNEILIVRNRFSEIKVSYKSKLISKDAKKKAIKEAKRAAKEKIEIKQISIPSVYYRLSHKQNKFKYRKTMERYQSYIQTEISDISKHTPTESIKKMGVLIFIFPFFPGAGQFWFKQKEKAVLMSMLSLFIYSFAIPYILGYRSYQGLGLKGLLTLGEGAMPRYLKSTIFLIEGIIALFLVIIMLVIFYLNYCDIKKLEKDSQKGIRVKKWFETKNTILGEGFPFLISTPALVALIFFVFIPVFTTIFLSFTSYNGIEALTRFQWDGLSNYIAFFSGKGKVAGPIFNIIGWTVLWTLCASTLAIVLGFSLALLMHSEYIKGKKLFRSIFILPWAIPGFVSIMLFRIMLGNGDGGVIREFLGIQSIISNTWYTRVALISIQGWIGSAYMCLLATGVLQAIPKDLYEAARIDGSSRFQVLKTITIPLILFQIAPLLIGSYTYNFNNFNVIYLFNEGGPTLVSTKGVYGTTDILISFIYKLIMVTPYQRAFASAATIILSACLILFAYIGFKNSKAFQEEQL